MSKLNAPALQRLHAVVHMMWRVKKENYGGWNAAAAFAGAELASSNQMPDFCIVKIKITQWVIVRSSQ